jgi:saccharopine dehydrogenase-like NADP-dependent oxidoreductase
MKTILVLGGSGNTGSRIAKLINEHSDSKVIIAGRMDASTMDTVYEIKCTEMLTDEHKLQLIVYAYMIKNTDLSQFHKTTFHLLNIRTGQVFTLEKNSLA